MTKKTIILVLIVLLILNTLFWINLIVQEKRDKVIVRGDIKPIEYKPLGSDTDKDGDTDIKVKYLKDTYSERLVEALRDWERSKGIVTLLVITDIVLIAISFMIIPLYKKD